jgi:hypothetical protein
MFVCINSKTNAQPELNKALAVDTDVRKNKILPVSF